MNQLTLRGLDKGLERRICQLAEQEHISINKAALKLTRRGSGLDRAAPDSNLIGDRLGDFIGSWSAAGFDDALAVFGEIDPEQWQ